MIWHRDPFGVLYLITLDNPPNFAWPPNTCAGVIQSQDAGGAVLAVK